MDKQNLAIKIAGAAGEGIMTTGLLFSKTCARHGLYVFDYPEYPSLIKGGHNTYQVHVSKTPIYSHKSKIDLLLALNKDALDFHQDELTEKSIIIYDQDDDQIDITKYNLKAKAINLPMVKLAKETGAEEVMSNNVAVGALIYFFGLNLSVLDKLISDIFKDKKQEVIDLNTRCAQAGYNFLKDQQTEPKFTVAKQENLNLLTMTGNEAVALGALAGGLQFFAAYPMTPATSILHFLAEKAQSTQIVVKHAEDEISAANMALGASFAGARTMTATSGGGFCYMIEALGLSGIAELPLVIVESQRPGPALGMPTWTGQGDLKFVTNAGNDEFPRFVLAPSDAKEAFDLSQKAQELAEKYQTPVILLLDKHLSESRYTLRMENANFNNLRFGFTQTPIPDQTGFFPRYLETESGISERPTPGQKDGNHLTNGYEHDTYGFSTEDKTVRKAQMDKRFRKLSKMAMEIPPQFWEGEPNSKITFISFGSTKGAILDAKNILKEEGIPVSMLNISWITPFPKKQVEDVINSSQNVVVVEGNSQGQLAQLITGETGLKIKYHLARYDGRSFEPEEIVDFVKNFKGDV